MNIEEFGVFPKDMWRWSVSEASYLFSFSIIMTNRTERDEEYPDSVAEGLVMKYFHII